MEHVNDSPFFVMYQTCRKRIFGMKHCKIYCNEIISQLRLSKGLLVGREYKFTRTTTYLDIPLQLGFKPSEFFTIVAGPQFSYLLEQKDEFTSAFSNTMDKQAFDNENIRKNILSLVAGVDINLMHFIVGTRAGWDLSNNHGDGSSSTPKYKNVWFQGTVGYIF